MKPKTKLAKWGWGIALCLLAVGLLAESDSDDPRAASGTVAVSTYNAPGDLHTSPAYDASSAATRSGRNYSFTEVDGNGNSRRFSTCPGISPRESLSTHLSSSVVYP